MAGQRDIQPKPNQDTKAPDSSNEGVAAEQGTRDLKRRLRGADYETGAEMLAPGRPQRPLPGDLASNAQRSLGRDFGHVRIDDSEEARRTVDAMGAKAVAVGTTVLLGSGFPGSDTPLGQRILAHELTHVAQSQTSEAPPLDPESAQRGSTSAEAEADRGAEAILAGRPFTPTAGALGAGSVGLWAGKEHARMGADAGKAGREYCLGLETPPVGDGAHAFRNVTMTQDSLVVPSSRDGSGPPLTMGEASQLAGDHDRTVAELVDAKVSTASFFTNTNHFYPLSHREWRAHHEKAVENAQLAFFRAQGGDARGAKEDMDKALQEEAFSLHFLEDAFAAGHQYPRALDKLDSNEEGGYGAGDQLRAKSYHDRLNEAKNGLPMASSKEVFNAHGDTTAVEEDYQHVARATTASVKAVLATSRGVAPEEDPAAYLPQPNVSAILSDPAAEPIWREMTGDLEADLEHARNHRKQVETTDGGTSYYTPDVIAEIEEGVFQKPPASAESESSSTSTRTGRNQSTYVVRKGDTLSRIARSMLGDATRYQDIARWNKIADPNRIVAGQKLVIYKSGEAPAAETATPAAAGDPGGSSTASTPAAAGFSRAEFLRLLLPTSTLYAPTAELLMYDAMQRGLVTQARPDDPVTRAEAALILARHAGILGADLAGKVYYFFDVTPGSWPFEAAHTCRLHGIFHGHANNCFRPNDLVDRAIAEEIIRRAVSPRSVSLAQQREGLTVEPLTEPSRRYPGKDAAVEEKYAFYMQMLATMGHSGDVSGEAGRYTLVGIRGFTPERLTTLEYDNAPGLYNDLLLVMGLDEQGTPVVREYPGSTDPGVAGMDALEAGTYDYQYQGQSFTSVSGNTVDGAYYRMTPETYQNDWYAVRDTNHDGRNDVDSGDQRVNNAGDRRYLIHRGGTDPTKNVGGWSYGCQVIAGKNAAGQYNVDDASQLLNKNPNKSFKYILVDGKDLVRAMGG